MTSATWVILGAGFAIAAANGANDVSKGIATLVGSGVTDYRRAIRWGTLWTGLGAIAGAAVAQSMMKTFGQGLVSPQVTPSLDAALATVAGAAAWIVLATRLSLPVSTTHAIVGSLIGAGLTAYGFGGLAWEALAGKVVLPLLLSPVLAWTVTTLIARLRPTAAPAFSADADCLCANLDASHVEPAGFGGAVVLRNSVRLDLMLGETAMCAETQTGAIRLSLAHAHWVTSGATSFVRGMNDAPKLVGLVLAVAALSPGGASAPWNYFLLISAGMVAGSLAAGRGVTHALAENVTAMDHFGGFTASLVTAVLVGAGAVGGLPMSTTHVSSGAILAAGRVREEAQRRTIRDMLFAWLLTVPVAAALGAAAFLSLKTMKV